MTVTREKVSLWKAGGMHVYRLEGVEMSLAEILAAVGPDEQIFSAADEKKALRHVTVAGIVPATVGAEIDRVRRAERVWKYGRNG